MQVNEQDLDCTVQAGIGYQELNRLLKGRMPRLFSGFCFPHALTLRTLLQRSTMFLCGSLWTPGPVPQWGACAPVAARGPLLCAMAL